MNTSFFFMPHFILQIHDNMTPLEMFAALVAAVCHDLDHPGVNQPFLIATDNHLAALYKVIAIDETKIYPILHRV